MYWMTLIPGHGCDLDQQKCACLNDKVRTTQPISTKLRSYIPLVLLITWLDFGEILLGTLFAKFSLKILDVYFQGQTFYWTYFSNRWSDWYETKRRCISWILGELCDLDLWPHPWPWPFKVKVVNSLIWGISCVCVCVCVGGGGGGGGGGGDCHGAKGMLVDHSWPWLWPMGNHGGVGGC